ncbi:unnamed protein product, partial [Staurois parvus]
ARPAVRALVYSFPWPLYPDPACLNPDSARTLPVPTSAIPDYSSACSLYLACPFATDPACPTTFSIVLIVICWRFCLFALCSCLCCP